MLGRTLRLNTIKMADSQAAFQEQMAQLQQSRSTEAAPVGEARSVESVEEPVAAAVDPQKAAEEEEVSRITQSLMAGEYEDATIQVSSPLLYQMILQ